MEIRNFSVLHCARRYKHDKLVRRKLRSLLKKTKKRRVKIFTKLEIVYEKDHDYVVLPYFDSKKKFQIWGVCIRDDKRKILLSKADFGRDAHDIAYSNQFYVLSLKAYVRGTMLPTIKDAELICASKSLIDEMMELFISYGVKADKLTGPYVIYTANTSYEENSKNKMVVCNVDAKNGEQFYEVGCFERYLTRLVKYD